MANYFDQFDAPAAAPASPSSGNFFDQFDPPKEDVTAGMALRGIPVLGAYVPQAEAAIRAAAHPLTGVGKPGETYAERYAANLPEREQQYRTAEEESPILSGALQAGGGAAALAPLGATALGARALGMTGSLPVRLGASAASGAGISAADVAARGGSLEDAKTAAMIGGGIGAAAAPLSAGISRVISPFASRAGNPTRAGQVAALRAEGVEPTAGQVTGSKPLQWAEQHWGEIAGRPPSEQTLDRFTAAALQRVGETGTRATPEVIDRAFSRIGQRFDDLAARNALVPDGAMGPQMRQVIAEYERLVPTPAKALQHYESEIAQTLASNRGTIPGETFQALASRMEAEARGTSSPELAHALRGMRSALNDAMERSLQRARSPDLGAWRDVRNQYRNLLVLERVATSPGTKLGQITPASLFQATKNVQGRRNLARGRGDYAQLAQAGSDLLRDLPSSGTAQRMYYASLPGMLGGAVGGMYGQGDPSAILTGAGLGFGPYLGGRMIMSRPGQRYLANQFMTPARRSTLQGGITGGLLDLMQ